MAVALQETVKKEAELSRTKHEQDMERIVNRLAEDNTNMGTQLTRALDDRMKLLDSAQDAAAKRSFSTLNMIHDRLETMEKRLLQVVNQQQEMQQILQRVATSLGSPDRTRPAAPNRR